jgi:hypothetical protein
VTTIKIRTRTKAPLVIVALRAARPERQLHGLTIAATPASAEIIGYAHTRVTGQERTIRYRRRGVRAGLYPVRAGLVEVEF